MVKRLESLLYKKELRQFIVSLRVLASNNKFDKRTIELIEKTIEKSLIIEDKKSLVDLYEIRISQIEHQSDYIDRITNLLQSMKSIAAEIDYQDGLALSYNIEWFIEKTKGDKEKSRKAMEQSLTLLNDTSKYDNKYVYYMCYYSYAVEKWLEERDPKSADILEECAEYFFQNGFYRSLVQALGILLIIYQRTQNSENVLETSKGLLGNKSVYAQLPRDVQAYTHYLVGYGYTLQCSLSEAKVHFEESRKMLKESYKSSIYFGYYLTTLSHLSAIYALQGKLNQATQSVEETEKLLQEEFIQKNLDRVSKRQIVHTFNLTKFYVQTRKKDFNIEESRDLIETIYSGTQINYSNVIMLSEFLLNAHLSYEQLLELQKKDNPSLKRVTHITSFMMEKTRTDVELTAVERLRNCIVTLWKRRPQKDETFIERSFVDLLLAQQYYDMGRFDEMNKLLKPYSDNLDTIEVLEQRLFIKGMMYFAAHRSGDFTAAPKFCKTIEECKVNNFTRLEALLTSYI